MTTKAVILAGGLGSRMQSADPSVKLDSKVAAVADRGAKWIVPVGNRALIEYSLEEIFQAGIHEVCLVVGPQNEAIRAFFKTDAQLPQSLQISFVIQPEPLGTANALLPARDFVGREPFISLNGDNVYPTTCLMVMN